MPQIERINNEPWWVKPLLWCAGILWFGIALIFIIFCIFALIYPTSFDKFTASMAFLGITAASLAIALFFLDKYDVLGKERVRDEWLERIEGTLIKIDGKIPPHIHVSPPPSPILSQNPGKGTIDAATKRIIGRKLISSLWYLGYFLMILGLIIAILGLIDHGLASIAIGISVVALSYSLKTDNLVKSIADLNFYEKIAVMARNIKPLVKTNERDESINLLCILREDLKAMSCLNDHISIEHKKEFKDIILQSLVPYIQAKDLIHGLNPVELQHIQEIKKLAVQIYDEDIWQK
jgi:hypothetical protein